MNNLFLSLISIFVLEIRIYDDETDGYLPQLLVCPSAQT